MPRTPPERREPLTVRLAANGRTWLTDIAVETGTDLSTVTRHALSIARRHEAELRALLAITKETQ